ncbi:hypothetical protein ACVWYF_004140 [Hymenobacter sp. UYAg731]
MPVTPLPPGTASEGYYIEDEDRFAGTPAQLDGSLFLTDTPDGTAAGGFVSRAVSGEQLRTLLAGPIGNAAKLPVKNVNSLARRDALDPLTMCLGTECLVYDSGTRYVLRYTYFTTPGCLTVFLDGNFRAGELITAQWMDAAEHFSGLRAFQEDPAGYLYHTGDYRRGYVSDASEEQAYVFQGPNNTSQPYPATSASDASWRHIGKTDVPAPVPLPAPNRRPSLTKAVRWLTNAARTAAGGTGVSLEELLALEPANMCAGDLVTVENDPQGAYKTYRVIYDGALRPPGSGLYVFADGDFVAGQTVPARVVRADAKAAGVPAYLSLPSGYAFAVDELVRAFVNGTASEQFFAAKLAGSAPPPTSVAGDTYWRHVNETDVPDPRPVSFQQLTGSLYDNAQAADELAAKLANASNLNDLADKPQAIVNLGLPAWLTTQLGEIGVVSLVDEQDFPASTGSNANLRGAAPALNTAYFLSATAAAAENSVLRLLAPTNNGFNVGQPIRVRLAENALPVVLYLYTGTAKLTVIQPGESLLLAWTYANAKTVDPAGSGLVWQVIERGGGSSNAPPVALTPTAGTVALDFAVTPRRTLAATGNVSFTTMNRSTVGAEKTVRVKNTTGAAITLSYEAWVSYGAALPATLAAGKTMILTLACYGTSVSDVDAAAVLSN